MAIDVAKLARLMDWTHSDVEALVDLVRAVIADEDQPAAAAEPGEFVRPKMEVVGTRTVGPVKPAEPGDVPDWFLEMLRQVWLSAMNPRCRQRADWQKVEAEIARRVAEVVEDRDRLAAEVQLLIDYFRSPEGDKFGREGDDKHWSTAKCAVEIMKRLAAYDKEQAK